MDAQEARMKGGKSTQTETSPLLPRRQRTTPGVFKGLGVLFLVCFGWFWGKIIEHHDWPKIQ
jgi:hypothetical protein